MQCLDELVRDYGCDSLRMYELLWVRRNWTANGMKEELKASIDFKPFL